MVRNPSRSIVTQRRRHGGHAYDLDRGNFATDLLFMFALQEALDYDELHYADAAYEDSPYSETDFEEVAEETESYVEPEAETFVNVSDDEDTRGGWGGDDTSSDTGFDAGSSDWDSGGGDSDFGGGGDDW